MKKKYLVFQGRCAILHLHQIYSMTQQFHSQVNDTFRESVPLREFPPQEK